MSDDKMITRIAALMAKAERAGSKHEAEAYFAKAQELMSKHAIDEALVMLSKGGDPQALIESEIIDCGTDRSVQNLLWIVAKNNNCAPIYVWRSYYSKSGQLRKKTDRIQIYGTRSDIEFTKMLFASLLMFCQQTLALMREVSPEKYSGKAYGYSFRLGFGTGVGAKMRMARDTATREAGAGKELVLRDKAKIAEAALEAANPDSTKRSGVLTYSNSDAYKAGQKRGAQADVSGGRNNLRERPTLPGA